MKQLTTFLILLVLPAAALVQSFSRVAWHFSISYLVIISSVTYAIYWHDKRRAQSSGWRIPENILHLLELAGGWPAAYLAQQVLRHKTKKRSYRIVYWLIVSSHQLLALDSLLNWKILSQLR